jgi:hypothetical protein
LTVVPVEPARPMLIRATSTASAVRTGGATP